MQLPSTISSSAPTRPFEPRVLSTGRITEKDLKAFLMKAPTIYAEAVAAGPARSGEVARMDRIGVLRLAERMREDERRREAANEALALHLAAPRARQRNDPPTVIVRDLGHSIL